MDNNEKVALLALAKGYRETLREAIVAAHSNSKLYYWQIEELDRLIKQLTD